MELEFLKQCVFGSQLALSGPFLPFRGFSFSHLDYCHLDSADKALATNHLRHNSKMSPGINF